MKKNIRFIAMIVIAFALTLMGCEPNKKEEVTIIALQDKLGWYEVDDYDNIVSKWDKIVELLKEVPTAEEIKDILMDVELDSKAFYELYSQEKIADGVLYAKDLKDRYTVLWLYYKYFAD